MLSFERSNTLIKTVNVKNLEVRQYYDRLKLYKNVNKALEKMSKYKCLVPFKNPQVKEYLLENTNIHLLNRIGSNSRYGTIYLTELDNLRFVIKISPQDKYNSLEVLLIQKLSKIVEQDKNPHFLFNYKFFMCNKKTQKFVLPTIIQDNNYYITANELVNGNFKNFLLDDNTTSILLLNALQQILIAILSFHHFSGGLFHNDCHYKNFIFLKIKPGGHFHYKIYNQDIYIKNMGYIWIIWDYGLIKRRNSERRLEDYFKILYFFLKFKNNVNYNKKSISFSKGLLDIVNKILEFKDNYYKTFGSSDKLFFENLFKISKLFTFELPLDSFIINPNPYIIK